MKHRFVWPICALSLFAALTIYVGQTTAQSGMSNTSGKCGCTATVSFLRIFNEAAQIQDLNAQIRQREQAFEAEAKQRQERIKTLQTALAAFKVGTADYESRRKELVNKNIEANTWFQVTEAEIEEMKHDWTKLIYEQSLDVIDKIAKERGYDAVLQHKELPSATERTVQGIRRIIQERDVVYQADAHNITDEVIRRLNMAYRAKNPQPGANMPNNP